MNKAILLACLAAVSAARLPAEGANTNNYAIYDNEADHLWNRLFTAFYHQEVSNNNFTAIPDGQIHSYGPDILDPPIGYHPRFLLDDQPFAKVNGLLDEFLEGNGSQRIRDRLKRAVLQRDLWAVFDVLAKAAAPSRFPMGSFEYLGPQSLSPEQEQRRATLERKLALAIHALALTRTEIEGLPDTYQAAIRSDAFSDVLESNRFNYLPHDLFATNSGWMEISPAMGNRAPPMVLEHTLFVGGRSVFRTFVKLPADKRGAVLADYIRYGKEEERYYRQRPLKPPALPKGTQVLLLREMICLDDHGEMVPTKIVESVQLRTAAPDDNPSSKRFAREAELSRSLLFERKQGGLRPVAKGELRTTLYEGLGHLRVDENGKGLALTQFPRNCAACHGANSMLTAVASAAKPQREANIEAIIAWKEKSGKLDLLWELMQPPAHENK